MKQKKFQTKLSILAIAASAMLSGMFFVFAYTALAFVGPSQAPPSGVGAIGSDASNNVSVGTSTTISGTKLLVVGASSDNTTNALQVLENNKTPIFILRDDGSVSIETSTVSAGNTVIGGNLTVGGTFTTGALVGSLSAGNVSSGQFGSNTGGGNYGFPGNLSVAGGAFISNAANGGGGVAFVSNPNDNSIFLEGYNSNESANANAFYITGASSANLPIFNVYANTSFFNGNVGIGTASPAGILQVRAATDADIRFIAGSAFGSGYAGIGLQAVNDAVNATEPLVLGGSKVLVAQGNVGIGTASPGYELDVQGGQINSSGGYCINGANCITSWPSGGTSQWTTTGSNIYYNTGGVGIGTASPNYLLSVGNSGSTGLEILNSPNGAGTADAIVFANASFPTSYNNSISSAISGYPSGSILSFNVANSASTRATVMTLLGTGNVGIGTVNPAAKLDVEGGNINVGAGEAYQYNGVNIAIASTTGGNYFFGNAGNLTMTGNGNNTGVGNAALQRNTTGFYNNAIGSGALFRNTTGYENTANGFDVLQDNTTGYWNTANGDAALYNNTTGYANTADGVAALDFNTTGYANTANGYYSLYNNNGYNNTADGYYSLFNNSTGIGNVALGSYAGSDSTNASNSFFVGNVQQSSAANDQNYSLLYGNFAGSAGTTGGQFLQVNGNFTVNGATNLNGTTTIAGGTISNAFLSVGSASGINCAPGWPGGCAINASAPSSSQAVGVVGVSNAYSGVGIYGAGAGIYGEGVSGYDGGSGTGIGVVGTGGEGVLGEADTSGGFGVYAVGGSGNGGTGVFASGNTYGVYANSGNGGIALYGSDLNNSGEGVDGIGNYIGVLGQTNGSSGYGVYGQNVSGGIGVYGNGSPDFKGAGGEYTSGGNWVNASARYLKTDFTPVNDQTILTKIDELPITQWVYKSDLGAQHIGPVAEDFYSIFGLGDNSTSISTIDPAGVALVGIKALDEKLNAQQQQIDALQTQNATLASEVQQLMNK